MRFITAVLFCLTSQFVFASADYAREKKWAEEITPSIVVGDPVQLEQKNHHKFLGIYTEPAKAKMGVVVVHGTGIHPDWGMIGTLRQRLPDYSYATLSIQMPILAADAKPELHLPLLPEAVERLQLAVAFLKGKGHKRIAIVSHSMGSRMSHAYMLQNPAGVSAWAALGMPAALGTGAATTYDGIKVPVLDLYGANDEPQVLAGALKRKISLKSNATSRQIVIPDTNHFFAGHEDEMVQAVTNFLDSLK